MGADIRGLRDWLVAFSTTANIANGWGFGTFSVLNNKDDQDTQRTEKQPNQKSKCLVTRCNYRSENSTHDREGSGNDYKFHASR